MHAWPELKSFLNINLDSAIDELFSSIQVIHDIEKIRVSIVLDGKDRTIKLVRPTNEQTLSIIFAPNESSADGIIQQLVQNTKPRSLCTVATNDSALKHGIRDMGASAISSRELEHWIERCAKRQTDLVKKIKKEAKESWRKKNF